jgi:pimeloyl-ACP methyl ester carboxylesterase
LLVHGLGASWPSWSPSLDELARRGVGGDIVALGPGGFWSSGELRYLSISLKASVALALRLQRAMPALTGNTAGRTALL